MPRVPSPEELGEDLEQIKSQIAELLRELKAGYVPRELYEARHTALRSEIALEMAAMKREQESTKGVAVSAKTLAQWCFGVLATSVIVALVGFVAAGVPA